MTCAGISPIPLPILPMIYVMSGREPPPSQHPSNAYGYNAHARKKHPAGKQFIENTFIVMIGFLSTTKYFTHFFPSCTNTHLPESSFIQPICLRAKILSANVARVGPHPFAQDFLQFSERGKTSMMMPMIWFRLPAFHPTQMTS